MNPNIFQPAFHVFCLMVTAGMSIYCIHKYVKNEDMASITFKTFHQDSNSIYPTITHCFYNDGIFNLNELKKHNIYKKSDYTDFLKGHANAKITNRSLAVDYDQVTLR